MVLPLSRSAELYLVLHFCKCSKVGSFSSIMYCYKQFFGFGNPAISAMSRAVFWGNRVKRYILRLFSSPFLHEIYFASGLEEGENPYSKKKLLAKPNISKCDIVRVIPYFFAKFTATFKSQWGKEMSQAGEGTKSTSIPSPPIHACPLTWKLAVWLSQPLRRTRLIIISHPKKR